MASPVVHVAKHVVPKKATGEEKTTTKRRHGMNGNLVALDIGMICVTSNVGNPVGPIYGRKCEQKVHKLQYCTFLRQFMVFQGSNSNFNRYFEFIWCCNMCVCAVA